MTSSKDILARLRDWVEFSTTDLVTRGLLAAAADEIERLREELEGYGILDRDD